MRLLPSIIQVAIDVPLRRRFDYCVTPQQFHNLSAGMRVLVPFGSRRCVGVVVRMEGTLGVEFAKIKPVTQVLDEEPLFSPAHIDWALWISDYYHHPLGEVLHMMMPRKLAEGSSAQRSVLEWYDLTERGREVDVNKLARQASAQARLIEWLKQHPRPVSTAELLQRGYRAITLQSLMKKQWIATVPPSIIDNTSLNHDKETEHRLNSEQTQAVEHILKASLFETFLLDGVTGSGKTEVYLQVITALLQSDNQALVLVPEIGLTPQTVQRFQRRFNVSIAVLHSHLSDHERCQAWLSARSGEARIIIGTRSAVFVPMKNLRVIVVDEEHDGSYIQSSGCRYSARDLAVLRARWLNIPIILGSATPSLESLHNAQQKRYQRLCLTQRAGGAVMPHYHLIDLRGQRLQTGLSKSLLTALDRHLATGQQALLFLNRRGFSPVFLCHSCGWSATCQHCDTRLVWHKQATALRCHYCHNTYPVPEHCEQCQQKAFIPLGVGIQRLEQFLKERYPHQQLARCDSDNMRGKDTWPQMLQAITDQRYQLLMGTQMLAKGHHFPQVTFVAMVDADYGLYSSDFRATEHMAQALMQVAGRAGRAQERGVVYIQTHHPDQPLWNELLSQGYAASAKRLLQQRQKAALPPFVYLVLLTVEAKKYERALHFAERITQLAQPTLPSEIEWLGPMPSLGGKRADHYRVQLLLRSKKRPLLHHNLTQLLVQIDGDTQLKSQQHHVRFWVDVDPQEV